MANYDDLPPIMDVTGKLDEIEIILEHNIMRQKCPKDLLELTFLQDFPQTSTENNPKRIIKYMFDKYIDGTRMINEQCNLLKTFTFIFRTEDGQVFQTTFNNHMQFRNDILMICHVYQLLFEPKYVRCKALMVMMCLMIYKYELDIRVHQPDPNVITFKSISVSYLSISLDLVYNNALNFHNIAVFFPFRLPVMIYAPTIISILPMLDNPPIAILIVIFLRIYYRCVPHLFPNISLLTLYQYILSYFTNPTYPEKMKLHLCTKYNIVVLEGDEYKFAPCFAMYRQKAKDLISKVKSNDPNLNYILSII